MEDTTAHWMSTIVAVGNEYSQNYTSTGIHRVSIKAGIRQRENVNSKLGLSREGSR